MRKLLIAVLLVVAIGAGAQRRRVVAVSPPDRSNDLTFVFDRGFRVSDGAVPAAGVDADGSVYLYYTDSVGPKLTIAADGLTFPPGFVPTDSRNDSRRVLMPDNRTWRRYSRSTTPEGRSAFSSSVSLDGWFFLPEEGFRYVVPPQDENLIGVFDFLSDRSGGVVLVYNGKTSGGSRSVRRARSTDGGLTFVYDRPNLLGDEPNDGANSYVDAEMLRLRDGRVRLLAMKLGSIYSFISTDDMYSFAIEPGVRLAPGAFADEKVTVLEDPSMVQLHDGDFRIYVNAVRPDGTRGIISATSQRRIEP